MNPMRSLEKRIIRDPARKYFSGGGWFMIRDEAEAEKPRVLRLRIRRWCNGRVSAVRTIPAAASEMKIQAVLVFPEDQV